MPTWRHEDASSCIIEETVAVPLGNSILKSSGVPFLMPAPHSFELVPGFSHVLDPPDTTFHPWSLKRVAAFFSLYGYGLTSSDFAAHVVGSGGTGP
jgi:hypothetical protein